MAVSPKMKQKFATYGDRVSFDLTFSLVKNRTTSGGTWQLGVFLGLSSSNRLVPLGVVATSIMNKEAYMQIFRMFFSAMGSQPKVIITDQERAVRSALNQLQEDN